MSPYTPPPNFDVFTDSFYHYIPSKSTALIFIVLFGISTVGHLVETILFRTWWGFPTVILAGVGEVIGWGGRYWSAFNDGTDRTPFIIQISCTILAPTPFLASYFVMLGRLIHLLGPQYSRLNARRYTVVFCSADIISLFVQAGGAGIVSGNTANPKLGTDIVLAGIIFQIVSLITYIILGVEFLWRFHTDKPIRTVEPMQVPIQTLSVLGGSEDFATMTPSGPLANKRLWGLDKKLQLFIVSMGFSVLLILIRGIYRTIEFVDGWNGRIISTQVYFNVLDGMMILVAMWTLNFCHPGFLLNPFVKRVAAAAGGEMHQLRTNESRDMEDAQKKQAARAVTRVNDAGW